MSSEGYDPFKPTSNHSAITPPPVIYATKPRPASPSSSIYIEDQREAETGPSKPRYTSNPDEHQVEAGPSEPRDLVLSPTKNGKGKEKVYDLTAAEVREFLPPHSGVATGTEQRQGYGESLSPSSTQDKQHQGEPSSTAAPIVTHTTHLDSSRRANLPPNTTPSHPHTFPCDFASIFALVPKPFPPGPGPWPDLAYETNLFLYGYYCRQHVEAEIARQYKAFIELQRNNVANAGNDNGNCRRSRRKSTSEDDAVEANMEQLMLEQNKAYFPQRIQQWREEREREKKERKRGVNSRSENGNEKVYEMSGGSGENPGRVSDEGRKERRTKEDGLVEPVKEEKKYGSGRWGKKIWGKK